MKRLAVWEVLVQQESKLAMKKIDKSERIGQIFNHPKYGEFEIIDYDNCENVTIIFKKTGSTQKTSYSHICKLEVFDAQHCGQYGNKKGSKLRNVNAYKCWYNMIHRVHNSKAYKEATICDEWYNFSIFEDWYSSQYKEIGWHLDKDLKNKGNKEYNPANCCFIPSQINTFIVKYLRSKGYSYNKRRRKFEAYCRENGDYVHLGMFDNENEARNSYIAYKIKVANNLIEKYDKVLDKEIKQAILNYFNDEK